MGILDGIVEWIAEQVMNLLDMINGAILGALGGEISVASMEGEYCAFSFSLPQVPNTQSAPADEASGREGGKLFGKKGKLSLFGKKSGGKEKEKKEK